jgi:NADPH:quinone reductase-like Zn-dependent oxidoreductase
MPLQLAASIPEAFLTAYQLLYFVGHFQRGEKVLIHAGASGVGHAAIQLVLEMGGLPIVTASGGKLALLRERLGLKEEQTIDYTQGSFVEKVQQATRATSDGGSDAGVDIVLCCVGANYFQDNLEVLAPGGRLVLYGTMSGSVVPTPLDLRVVMKKGLTISGTTLRARPLAYKKALVDGLWTEERVGKFVKGEMKSVIYRTFGWEEVGEAHAMMERNENVGKILLSVDDSLK